MRKKLGLAAGAAAVLVLAATPAFAHVSINPAEGPAEGFVTVDFEVPHGCDDSPTTSLAVQIPEGVGSVTPEEEEGWEIETAGSEEQVSEVTWTATGEPLEPHHLRRFGMSLQLPEGSPGDVVYFPTVQTCEEGSTRWIEIPGDGDTEEDLENPAPAVMIVEGEGGHGGSESDEGADATEPEAIDAEPAASTDDGTDAVTWAALIVGALGVAIGAAALARARR